MKSMFYGILAIFTALLINGCGEDRSHGMYDVSELSTTQESTWVYETKIGKKMVENNFVYIPGGFDVDSDGLEEGGFWLSMYEAKEDTNVSASTTPLITTDKIQTLMGKHFQLFDPVSEKFEQSIDEANDYLDIEASQIEGLEITKVHFESEGEALRSISPLEAVISLQNSQIEDGFEIDLPSEKQWMQLVKLIINNPKNWTGGEVGKGKIFQGKKFVASDRGFFFIENSLLGKDIYVPETYSVEVYDLSGGVAEWTSGLVAINDRFISGNAGAREYSEVPNAPAWWKPILKDEVFSLGSISGAGQYHDGTARAGANDTLEISAEGTGDVDRYAAVARGGSNSIDDEFLVGISAAKLDYGPGYKGPTIGFRAASGYLY